MPIFEYRAINITHAFILNSLASATVIIIALYIKGSLDTYTDKKGYVVNRQTNFQSLSLTFIASFFSSLIVFYILHFLTGFGGGMLVSS